MACSGFVIPKTLLHSMYMLASQQGFSQLNCEKPCSEASIYLIQNLKAMGAADWAQDILIAMCRCTDNDNKLYSTVCKIFIVLFKAS